MQGDMQGGACTHTCGTGRARAESDFQLRCSKQKQSVSCVCLQEDECGGDAGAAALRHFLRHGDSGQGPIPTAAD